ncbi:hypothetical protein E3T54_16100 [Cryobacterium sp. Sr8]|uniref:hypothetical protein n=1 Tax=Cryobacterium sp. Sr8 TaxID=1259203 RepID=UPI00106B04AF|nr:hypothetical protein [Cryobacterium sp. Sr8]TFD74286.1 hypothetical protein E3T54_16100 [Cryobacterium sp. Sr8]
MSTIAPDQAPATTTPASPVATGGARAVSSLVLGLVSIFAGWTFLAPLAGLVVGILAFRSEPHNRTMAIWGIALNAVMLAGVILLGLAAVVFGLAVLPFAVVM